ncbi:putative hydroxymethylpyrimidine transport system permease protein [Desulfonispora thiosulfatigenes DSM 11270]|uniref:Putative hydroxymethylpyrimidine transport system permease protein n=1 Tax=Desulfonispora thiosulfatigenes DSM 11270 TaxID=656914 RepID=A0A1W1UKJ1_DESTI|nr:ABC transporter permease [Desulfonispora thiosulfatigenes]SMB81638.1 putative hydroxymethylpyrimidine transport system permease protein [Desulfonispora thiosulfatigenes DSM 11270]
MKKMKNYNAIIFLSLFLIFWEVAVRLLKVKQFILPAPTKIAMALWSYKKVLFTVHFPVTLAEVMAGLLISVILSVLISVLMLKSKKLEEGIYPFLVISQTIPIIVLSPVIIMWFGYGLSGKIAITVLITFFPIVVNTFEGFKSIDIKYLNLLKTMGATESQIFWKVRVPACLPNFFIGLKVGAAVSVIGAVIGEWLGGNSGLGVFSRRMSSNLEADAVFAAVIILALLGIFLFGVVKILEKIFIPWSLNTKKEG